MNLLHVIPIARGIGKETLTYFTSLPVFPGALVSVPLRKHTVPALVVEVEDALEAKTKIRSAGHTMRKVEELLTPAVFTPAFIAAARNTADFHATTTGAILARFTIQSFTEPFARDIIDTRSKKSPAHSGTTADTGLLQTERDERFAAYRRMIRESFARNESVFLLVPETGFVAQLEESIGKGISDRVIILHGGLSPTARAAAWAKAITASHPILVIGTGAFLSLPRSDIGTVIIEGERSHAYKEVARPHMDTRVFARLYAKHLDARVVSGGLPLRVETLAGKESGTAYAIGTVRTRVGTTARVSIVPMGKKHTDTPPRKKGPYDAVLSPEVAARLSTAHTAGKHSLVFVARKGLHGITVCNDCGRIVSCARCGAPLVLYKATGDDARNTHICRTCGARTPAKDRCAHCNSWKLATIGIGSQYVEEAITRLLPNAPIIRLDGDTATTPARVAKKISLFERTPGAILITTGIGLPTIHPPVPLVVVASMDTILSFPDFRAGERAIGTLATLRALASEHLVIQTRNPEHTALAFAEDGNLADRYREDLSDRKDLGYPPFTVLIKLTVEGSKSSVDTVITHAETLLSAYKPHRYAGAATKRNAYRAHILLKIPALSWPDAEFLAKLHSLPPSVDIDVNPESVL